jgi:hypothetical protein
MTAYDEAVALVEHLSIAEQLALISHLSQRLSKTVTDGEPKTLSWEAFIERTAGSLADDPIERPPQPPLEEREMMEVTPRC